MTFVYYAALVLHILCCIFLICVVLLQQGKGQDLASAFGGGGTQTAFGPRGSANVLSRATTILGGVFMITSLTLSRVHMGPKSVLDQLPAAAKSSPAPVKASPLAPPASTPSAAASPAAAAPTPAPSAK
jgi:preprotein translocase subunit SecG